MRLKTISRVAIRLLGAAFLLVATVDVAAAQLEPGASAEIAARAGARVNMRSEPRVRSGNVVSTVVGGDVATVLETASRPPYVWYRLRSSDGGAEGWVRGDLVRAAPQVEAPVLDPIVVEPVQPVRPTEGEAEEAIDRPPFEERLDWTRHLPRVYRAVTDCAQTSSSQPAQVSGLVPMSRGLVNVLVRDASWREWDCIIRDQGGTPLRFDPLSAAGTIRVRPEDPSYIPIGGYPAPEPDECRDVEVFADPATGVTRGWIIHPMCN